jgi:glycosyltransferase 2 family protein
MAEVQEGRGDARPVHDRSARVEGPKTSAQPASARPASVRPASARPPRLARLLALFRLRRQLFKRLGAAASLVIIAISATIFVRTLMRIDLGKFERAIAGTGGDQIALAFGFTVLSYLALTGYDAVALRHLKLRVPYRLTAAASFASYAASFTLGFPLITGAAIRYWVYAPAGLSAGKIASLTVVAGVTFWLGMGFIVGVGFLTSSVALSEINHFDPIANRLIGAAILAALAACFIWVARMRARGTALVGTFRLPGPATTLGQMALGVIDICSAAATLYVLLPKGSGIGFPTFATLYSFASMLGIASHSPGGLGVFEATILQGVGGDFDSLLAALLLFRCIYYLAPFIAAMALLGGIEAVRRWRSLREAVSEPTDWEQLS